MLVPEDSQHDVHDAHDVHDMFDANYTSAATEAVKTQSSSVTSQWDALQWLKAHGFAVNEDNVRVEGFQQAVAVAEAWMATRDKLGKLCAYKRIHQDTSLEVICY